MKRVVEDTADQKRQTEETANCTNSTCNWCCCYCCCYFCCGCSCSFLLLVTHGNATKPNVEWTGCWCWWFICWNVLDYVIVVDAVIDFAAPHHSILVSKTLPIPSRCLPKSIVGGLCDMNHYNMIQCVTQIVQTTCIDDSDGSHLKC